MMPDPTPKHIFLAVFEPYFVNSQDIRLQNEVFLLCSSRSLEAKAYRTKGLLTTVEPLLADDVSSDLVVPALREVDNHPNLAGRLAAGIPGLDEGEALLGSVG